ncbi:MAG: NADPH-dependent FMN reductase [Candidatus Binatia bacterium]
MKLDLLVIYGSVRSTRQGIKAARFVTTKLAERGHDVFLVDPLEWPLPLLDKMYKEYPPGGAPDVLERLAQKVKRADAYVIVSGEYNHSIPPALSNLLDHFLEEYFYKPSAIVCYSAGSGAGLRAAMQLRAMTAEMGMSSIPSILPIAQVQSTFQDDGTPVDPKWHQRVEKFFAELEWYARALKTEREREKTADRSECEAEKLVPKN